MYELIWVGENTYYIESPSKVGVYDLGGGRVCLIDSGNDTSAAKKILQILQEKGWTLDRILCTHSHADHIGGNHYLQEKTGCPIYAAGFDRAFIENPVLEPTLLFGGRAPEMLYNKYLMAKESTVRPLTQAVLPEGLTLLRLDGHAPCMSAIHTDDDIWFIADAIVDDTVFSKYPLPYVFNVQDYLHSVNSLRNLQARLFIPSHATPMEDISDLIRANVEKVEEICELILNLCRMGTNFDSLLGKICNHYGMTLDLFQYALSGSTLRAYLSYLHDNGSLRMEFSDNRLFWRTNPRV